MATGPQPPALGALHDFVATGDSVLVEHPDGVEHRHLVLDGRATVVLDRPGDFICEGDTVTVPAPPAPPAPLEQAGDPDPS